MKQRETCKDIMPKDLACKKDIVYSDNICARIWCVKIKCAKTGLDRTCVYPVCKDMCLCARIPRLQVCIHGCKEHMLKCKHMRPAHFAACRPGGQAAGAAAAAAQHYKNWMCTTRSAAVTAAAATAANPPGGGTAAGSMAVPTGLYAGFFNSISPSRSAPVGVSRANTTFGSSSSNAGTTAAAAARGIESAGSVLGNMVVYKQRQQRQQQRIIPGAVGAQAALLAGSMLAAPSAAAAALRGSSVLRAVGPQTPVQQHISSRNTLIKRPIEVPTA